MNCIQLRSKRIFKNNVRQLCHIRRPVKSDKPKIYDSSFVESQWYSWWKANNFFNSEANNEHSKRNYMICLPPPNITGNLHIGHALTVAIEDTIARWRRMSGDSVIWVPGFDHAGIATQLVVERRIMNSKGIRRTNLTRDQFTKECESWKCDKIQEISDQLEKLGTSLDWRRCYYTMDETFSKAVYNAFQLLYDQKIIYRSRRLVNWSPYLKSTLSDIEIQNVKIDEPKNLRLPGRQKSVPVGWMYFVDYEIVDHRGKKITVATTRPETIPADVAIAVNPEDTRYGSLVGSFAQNPLIPSRLMRIITDSKVDKSVGTGALKVTPGHDWIDYDIGSRHNLQLDLNIFNEDGTCSSNVGVSELIGLDRFDAREKAVDILLSKRLLSDKKPHSTSIPVCARSGDIIEPMLKDQWFMNTKSMADRVLTALDKNEIRIVPPFWEHQMRLWLKDERDWCISRQLWWGHRIPVFRVKFSNATEDSFEYIVAKNETDALDRCSLQFPNKTVNTMKQETDVLDTWFSSSLVPLVANGWPNNFKLSSGYPLSLMETGNDILTFWVTRMAMLCLHLSGEIPFKEILLHGIVRDAHGRKMSKSLGNVIDPMDVKDGKSLEHLNKRIDASDFSEDEKMKAKEGMKANFPKGITKCGADALRYSLLTNDIKSTTINIHMAQIETHRNFCNKIWQGYSYIKPILNSSSSYPYTFKEGFEFAQLSKVDAWILSRLTFMVQQIDRGFRNYDFSVATHALFHFWMHEFCDVYLEWTKQFVWGNKAEQLAHIRHVFQTVIDVYLCTLAPIMPFLSEEIHSDLPWTSKDVSVHQRKFPHPEEVNYSSPLLDKQMQKIQSIVYAVRSLKQEFGLPLKTPMKGIIVCDSETVEATNTFSSLLQKSTHLDVKAFHNDEVSVQKLDLDAFVSTLINADVQLFLEIQNAERSLVVERLEKQISKKKKTIQLLESKSRFLTKINEKRQQPFNFDPTVSVKNLQNEIERLEKMISSVKL